MNALSLDARNKIALTQDSTPLLTPSSFLFSASSTLPLRPPSCKRLRQSNQSLVILHHSYPFAGPHRLVVCKYVLLLHLSQINPVRPLPHSTSPHFSVRRSVCLSDRTPARPLSSQFHGPLSLYEWDRRFLPRLVRHYLKEPPNERISSGSRACHTGVEGMGL